MLADANMDPQVAIFYKGINDERGNNKRNVWFLYNASTETESSGLINNTVNKYGQN